MTHANNRREDAVIRMKALNDERVDMVKRHAHPAAIRAVSAAYIKAYEDAFGRDPDEGARSCAKELLRN